MIDAWLPKPELYPQLAKLDQPNPLFEETAYQMLLPLTRHIKAARK